MTQFRSDPFLRRLLHVSLRFGELEDRLDRLRLEIESAKLRGVRGQLRVANSLIAHYQDETRLWIAQVHDMVRTGNHDGAHQTLSNGHEEFFVPLELSVEALSTLLFERLQPFRSVALETLDLVSLQLSHTIREGFRKAGLRQEDHPSLLHPLVTCENVHTSFGKERWRHVGAISTPVSERTLAPWNNLTGIRAIVWSLLKHLFIDADSEMILVEQARLAQASPRTIDLLRVSIEDFLTDAVTAFILGPTILGSLLDPWTESQPARMGGTSEAPLEAYIQWEIAGATLRLTGFTPEVVAFEHSIIQFFGAPDLGALDLHEKASIELLQIMPRLIPALLQIPLSSLGGVRLVDLFHPWDSRCADLQWLLVEELLRGGQPSRDGQRAARHLEDTVEKDPRGLLIALAAVRAAYETEATLTSDPETLRLTCHSFYQKISPAFTQSPWYEIALKSEEELAPEVKKRLLTNGSTAPVLSLPTYQ